MLLGRSREKPSAARFPEASGLELELSECRAIWFWHAALHCIKDELYPLGKKTAPARVKVRVKCSGDNFLLISRSVWPGWAVCLATTSDVSPREGRTGLLPPAQLFSMLLSCVLFSFPSLKAYRSYRSLRLLLRACLRPGIYQRDQQEQSLTSPLKAGLFTRYWLGSGVSVSREWAAGASLLSQVQSAANGSFIFSAVTAAGTGHLLAVGEAEQ